MPTVVKRKNRSTLGGPPQADGPALFERRVERLLECTGAVPWEADASTWQFIYVGPQAARLPGGGMVHEGLLG